MKILRLTSQFKRDLKRYRHHPEKIAALEVILNYLEAGLSIPAEYKPHLLTGNFKGYMECHVENDLLLVWLDPKTDEIKLVRFGTHSEVFRM